MHIDAREIVLGIECVPETGTSTTPFAEFDFPLVFGFGFILLPEPDRAVLVLRCLVFPFNVDLDLVEGGCSVPKSASEIKY